MVLLLLYTAFFVPYKIAFMDVDPVEVKYMDYCVDLLFFIDIFVNFFTCFDDPVRHTPVKDPKRIASNYIKSWFFLDLLACLPFDLIISLAQPTTDDDDESQNKTLKLARLSRLYRLYRLIRILRMAKILKVANSGFANYIEAL